MAKSVGKFEGTEIDIRALDNRYGKTKKLLQGKHRLLGQYYTQMDVSSEDGRDLGKKEGRRHERVLFPKGLRPEGVNLRTCGQRDKPGY